jgi:hypothetical protein
MEQIIMREKKSIRQQINLATSLNILEITIIHLTFLQLKIFSVPYPDFKES